MSAISTWHPSDLAPPRGVGPMLHAFVASWVLFALGLGAIAGGSWWATNSTLFDLRDLDVTGNEQRSSAAVARAAGLTGGTNVLWISERAVESRLEADPWILEAHVSRTLPSSISVTIVERTPIGVLSGGSVLVAGDGTVLGEAAGPRPSLPEILLSGPAPTIGTTLSVPQMAVAQALPADLRGGVAQIGMAAGGTIEIHTTDGTRVLFGDASDAVAKWGALRGVLAWARTNGVRAEYIDVRSPIAPALRPVTSSSGPVGDGS